MKHCFTLFIIFLATIASSFGQTKQFRSNLYILDPNGNPVLMDGTLSMFHNDYSNEVNNQDARKMFNPSENLGMERAGKILIVERRQDLNGPDTIFFKLWNTRIITYRLELTSKFLEGTGINALLFDKYLNTVTSLSTSLDNYYDFQVTADVNSKRTDRFMVVFNPAPEANMLPLNFVHTSAVANSAGINLAWETANENNVKDYTVEHSTDGVQFASTHLTAEAQNRPSNNYQVTDATVSSGYHYYRIRGNDRDGKATFSKVMKVSASNVSAKVSMYPNPATASNIQVNFSGQQKGQYKISLINGFGSILHTQVENLTANPAQIKLTPNSALPQGIYRIEVAGPDGYRTTVNAMITK